MIVQTSIDNVELENVEGSTTRVAEMQLAYIGGVKDDFFLGLSLDPNICLCAGLFKECSVRAGLGRGKR